jgi:hypothetical protein
VRKNARDQGTIKQTERSNRVSNNYESTMVRWFENGFEGSSSPSVVGHSYHIVSYVCTFLAMVIVAQAKPHPILKSHELGFFFR